MTISKLPSGRYRAQVWDAAQNKKVSAESIIGGPKSYATKRDAKQAEAAAYDAIGSETSVMTVAQWRDRWLSDPLFRRTKDSTMIHLAERTKAFAARYGALPLSRVGDQVVAEWLAGATRNGTVPVLRTMFNDAMSAKAGRLVASNPFAGLGLEKSKGNAEKAPPSEEMVARLIGAGQREHVAFGAWLQVAAYTGMRPGELDALKWDRVDFERGRISVVEQFNAMTRTFTLPKNNQTREALLTPMARDALLSMKDRDGFCFTSLRGGHFTASTRAYHWKAVKAEAGYKDTPYLATRHFAGWYMTNVLDLNSEDVAIALGHTDGGDLVRSLYGHRDKERALDKVAAAYADVGRVVPLKLVKTAHGTTHEGA